MGKNEQRGRDARVAAEAARRDRHAQRVAARAGDPQFVQRERTATGYHVTPAQHHRAEVREALQHQLAFFRERFGRDPRPDEPIFFDNDADGDEPTPFTEEVFGRELRNVAEGMDDPRLKALVLASAEVGYFVTTENDHTFSHQEVEAFGAAFRRHFLVAGGDPDELD